jgi:hypothetical protein
MAGYGGATAEAAELGALPLSICPPTSTSASCPEPACFWSSMPTSSVVTPPGKAPGGGEPFGFSMLYQGA